jgi:hypothetical protein
MRTGAYDLFHRPTTRPMNGGKPMRLRILALGGLLLGLLLLAFSTLTAHTAALQSFRQADQQA